MARKIGWEDESITGTFNDDDKKYRGVKGETHVIRVMQECVEFRIHFVDDVLDPSKDGEPRGFNKNCSREWSEADEDYVGDCDGCDREYDISSKFAAGILHLGTYKGRSKTVQKVDPENGVRWWPFGGDKYRKLSDLSLELSRAEKPKKLHQVELVIKCEDEAFQKLNVNVSQAKALTTKAHVAEWKATGEKLVDEMIAGTTAKDWTRTLKRKKKRKKDDDEEQDKKPARRRPKAKEEPDEEPDEIEDEGTGEEDLDALLEDL